MKVLVQSPDGATNEGIPGTRAYQIARVLAEQLPDARVTLSAPSGRDIQSPRSNLSIVPDGSGVGGLLRMLRHDVIIAREFPASLIAAFPKRLVLDLHAPIYTERLESSHYDNASLRARHLTATRRWMELQLTLADYVMCPSESLRDFWIGVMSNIGLIAPRSYDANSTLRRLIDVVPDGVRPAEPEHSRQVVKGVLPGIGSDDKLLIWNGPASESLDAPTVVRAMADIAKQRDDVKLLFMSTEPESVSTGAEPLRAAVDLSRELGLYGRTVFVNEGWVPHDEIGSYLSEADLGVCAGFDNLESRFAYRTRFVDLFWARVPIVCTRGDELIDRVEREPLGVVVPPGDAEAFANAVLRLLDDETLYERCRSNLTGVSKELSWERVLAPLVEYIVSGETAAASRRARLLPALERMTTYRLSRLRGPAFY